MQDRGACLASVISQQKSEGLSRHKSSHAGPPSRVPVEKAIAVEPHPTLKRTLSRELITRNMSQLKACRHRRSWSLVRGN